MAASTDALLSLFASIEKANKASGPPTYKFKRSSSGPAPYTHSKGSGVNPTTSKGSEKDGGGHHGVFGTFRNLANDVEQTVTGLPGGIVQTVHDPIGTGKAIAKDYQRRYSPLVHGDFGKFASEIQQHPLAPLLDLASVATGGGSIAAKVGQSGTVLKAVEAARASKAAEIAKTAEEASAPVRKRVEALNAKVAKTTVDRTMAAKRAESGVADVAASSARAMAKHDETIATLQKQIVAESKTLQKTQRTAYKTSLVREGANGIRRSRMDTQLSTTVQHLIKLQKFTTPRSYLYSVEKGSAVKAIRLPLSGNPVRRLRTRMGIAAQEATIGGKHLISPNMPIVGLRSRALKAANNQQIVDAGRIRAPQKAALAAADALDKVAGKDTAKAHAMATAANGIIDGVAPRDYVTTVRNTRSTGESIQHSINKGMTQEEHHAHTEELVKDHTSKHANELYAATKQYFQREAYNAGNPLHPFTVQRGFTHKLIDSPEVKAIVGVQRANSKLATDAAEQRIKLGTLTADEASRQAVLHVTLARAARGEKALSTTETNALFDKAGLPRPSYNPDTLTFGEAAKAGGAMKESKGTLYTEGTRQHDIRTIVLRHELASKATDAYNIHQLMMSAAVKIPDGVDKPKGMVWVKDGVATADEVRQGLFATQGKDARNANTMPMDETFYTKLAASKRPAHGMAISRQAANDLALGRHVMTQARQEALHKGILAWKYLVLTRPLFVVHNVLGNQAMYHLKNGWNFASFHRMRNALKSGAFDEHHPAEGLSFGESEKMGAGKSKLAKAGSKTLNVFNELVGQHEHWLRQLTFYEAARKMPGVKREIARLKGGTLDTSKQTLFHQAYSAAVAKNPTLRDQMTKHMDDTLGNYRYYNHAERNLKMLSPFYGWERHSVRNYIRMMEDNPATMATLTQLGMVGHTRYNKDFGPGMPDFVHSYVQDSSIQWMAEHLGLGDKVNMIDYGPLNPWGTAVEVGKAANDPKKGLLKLAGPVVTAPIEELTGKSLLTGAPVDKTKIPDKGSLEPLAMLERIVRSTPIPKLVDEVAGTAKEHKMLPTTPGLKIAQNLGLDAHILDKMKARQQNARQNAPKDKYGNTIFKHKKKKSTPTWNYKP